VYGIFEGGNADTLTHCFEVLSVGFGNLEGGNGNGNGMAAQAHCGKVSIGQAGVALLLSLSELCKSGVRAALLLGEFGDNAGSQAASHLCHLQSRLFAWEALLGSLFTYILHINVCTGAKCVDIQGCHA
jgi:hypothetical protein